MPLAIFLVIVVVLVLISYLIWPPPRIHIVNANFASESVEADDEPPA
jgi:hypothetical protein